MRVKISENMLMDIEGRQVTLREKRVATKEDTKEEYVTWDIVGYFVSIESATKYALQLTLASKDVTILLKDLNTTIKQAVIDMKKQIKKEE